MNPGSSSNYASSGRPNSVNLRAAALEQVFDAIETAKHSGGKPHKGRIGARWPFRREALEVTVEHPGGSRVTIRVACRNLSRGGLSVLHSSYMYEGTDCVVMLPHAARGEVPVTGKIVRCTHYKGVIHELGIAFNRAINAREFAAPDPLANCFCFENVRPEDLKGKLLLIDPSDFDRSIFMQFLRGSPLQIETVSTFAEAVLTKGEHDVIVLSSTVAAADPQTAVRALRQDFNGPIVMIVPDASAKTRARVLAQPVDVYLTNPITQELVHRALAEALTVEVPPQSNLNSAGFDLATTDLGKIGAELLRTVSARDTPALRQVCTRINTISEGKGWPNVCGVIAQILTGLSTGGRVEDAMPLVNKVIEVCDSNADLKAPVAAAA